jgi:hypothetical protein
MGLLPKCDAQAEERHAQSLRREMRDAPEITPLFATPLVSFDVFPAWMMHQVRPYRGIAERISIAFNLAV